MNLTIDISEQNAAVLEAQPRAAQMPTERYLAQIVERALASKQSRDRDRLERHLDYMASQVTAETTPDEMEAAISDALASVRPQRSWRP
jgi:hypothetical protein